MKDNFYERISPRIRAKNIEILTSVYNDASRPEAVRRSAALRLSRLRAAGRPATGLRLTPGTTTTRTKPATAAKPATPQVPTEKAKFEAVQSFFALSRTRSALHRKRCTAAEYEIKATMVALMPAAVPTTDDATAWRNFIAQIDGLLSEIKNIKPL
jgi:hypothetical protein